MFLFLLLAGVGLSHPLGRPTDGFGLRGGWETTLDLPDAQWFDQRTDHFNTGEYSTWKQRFWTNDQHYQPGGPIFLSIGGEAEANPIWVVEGAMMEYAAKYGAFAAQLEHRFYGKSQPFADLSTEHLAYLSSEQALADLAKFLTHLKENVVKDANKIIVFGGSYSGAMAAWFRLKYPSIAHGAVASSAPVFAEVDFTEYYEVVAASLQTTMTGKVCTDRISDGIKAVDNLLGSGGRAQLRSDFNLCEDLDQPLDVTTFRSTLAGNFAGTVQYNRDNRAFEGATDNTTIDTLCGLMVKADDGYHGLMMVNDLISKGQSCVDVSYSAMISSLKQTGLDSPAAEGGRQWTYQTCSEFCYYQSSDSDDQPFTGFPVDYSLQQCIDIFGDAFSFDQQKDNVAWTNTVYGGRDLKGSRILLPNGSIDPWHALGILDASSVPASVTPIYINGTAHCANEYPSSSSDLPGLVAARIQISKTLGEWLK